MNAHTISLHRPLHAAWIDTLRRTGTRAFIAWQAYLARRRVEAAERQLLELNLRTLEDIGAPHGLIGQRRWQDEQRVAEVERLLVAGRR